MQLLFNKLVDQLLSEEKETWEIVLINQRLKDLGYDKNNIKDIVYTCIYKAAEDFLGGTHITYQGKVNLERTIKIVLVNDDAYVDWQFNELFKENTESRRLFKTWFHIHKREISASDVFNYISLKKKGLKDDNLKSASNILDI